MGQIAPFPGSSARSTENGRIAKLGFISPLASRSLGINNPVRKIHHKINLSRFRLNPHFKIAGPEFKWAP
jgi:hypothetical protein